MNKRFMKIYLGSYEDLFGILNVCPYKLRETCA